MPLINVKLIEDVFTPEQKVRSSSASPTRWPSIEGESMRGVTWVVVDEVHRGDWSIGGTPLRTADVKALAAGTPG